LWKIEACGGADKDLPCFEMDEAPRYAPFREALSAPRLLYPRQMILFATLLHLTATAFGFYVLCYFLTRTVGRVLGAQTVPAAAVIVGKK
jgi:hypothetical protein